MSYRGALALLGVLALGGSARAQTFTTLLSYTGSAQTFTVPHGVSSLFVQLWGAGGGGSNGGGGAYLSGTLLVLRARGSVEPRAVLVAVAAREEAPGLVGEAPGEKAVTEEKEATVARAVAGVAMGAPAVAVVAAAVGSSLGVWSSSRRGAEAVRVPSPGAPRTCKRPPGPRLVAPPGETATRGSMGSTDSIVSWAVMGPMEPTASRGAVGPVGAGPTK